jgi:hypothetical protein
MATIAAPHFSVGTAVGLEVTVEGSRHFVRATIVETPFFNPSRKTAMSP